MNEVYLRNYKTNKIIKYHNGPDPNLLFVFLIVLIILYFMFLLR